MADRLPRAGQRPLPDEIERSWGIFDPTVNPILEVTYSFLATFLAQMAEPFKNAARLCYPSRLVFREFERRGMEELLYRELSGSQPLLVGVLEQGFQRLSVPLDPV